MALSFKNVHAVHYVPHNIEIQYTTHCVETCLDYRDNGNNRIHQDEPRTHFN